MRWLYRPRTACSFYPHANRTTRQHMAPKAFSGYVGALVLVMAMGQVWAAGGEAQPKTEPKSLPAEKTASADTSTVKAAPEGAAPSAGGSGSAMPSGRQARVPFADLVRDAKPIEGLIKLYRKDDRLLAELGPGLLDRDLIVVISIARGIGEGQLLGGMSWGFGDDWIWQFRQVDDRIQVVRRNVRFTAAQGTPESLAVKLAYTDSILFSLPVLSTAPSGAAVVDLGTIFMSDLPRISGVLPGFLFARDRSSWASVKGFRDNVEIEVAATYASPGTAQFETVPDSRGVTVNIHYSVSLLPQTGYRPRLADDRAGYFVTAVKDFSRKYESDRFVRYINRWNLVKADPLLEVSPPKKPIIFWLEKTIPWEYRKPIREGILEWNKAFEKAGFANAIEVRDQQPGDTWDPEDINYNTFRWITAGAGFAMGPSRVNPLTGEILDADVIFDADFLSFWKDEYDVLGPQSPPSAAADLRALADVGFYELDHAGVAGHPHPGGACQLARGMGLQLALAALAVGAEAQSAGGAPSREEFRKLVYQAVKSIAMHEVGHTLGLRHNFKASSLWSLEEINTREKTHDTGLAASIMDYLPVNLMPKGHKQGDYFSTTIGPYDYWAIEYGYRVFPGGPETEAAELRKLASRSAEPALSYAPDEDARPGDPDPLTNRFDLGRDPLQFARARRELVAQLLPALPDRVTAVGEGYQRTRRAFNLLLQNQASAMHFVARLIGGVYVHRHHKGDPGAKPPFVVVEPARQREALALLQDAVFGPQAFDFPPALYNLLVDARWAHWGVKETERSDYPVRSVFLGWQDRVLAQLLSPTTLARLTDSEMKIPPDQDAFTAAELLAGLTQAIFREVTPRDQGQFSNRKPAIAPLRRDLQRRYVERLAALVLGTVQVPEDCQTLAYAELETIENRLKSLLASKAQLDVYTQAHARETAARVRKVLEARLDLRNP